MIMVTLVEQNCALINFVTKSTCPEQIRFVMLETVLLVICVVRWLILSLYLRLIFHNFLSDYECGRMLC